MCELMQIKEDIGVTRLHCWKCRINDVEMIARDSIYRLKCNLCYKYRKEKWRLEWMRTRKNMLLSCQFCWDAYRFNTKLEVHKCPMVGVYQCGLCACQLNSCKSLKVHLKIAHGVIESYSRTRNGKTLFECTICKKAFSRSVELIRHLRTHTGVKPFECNYCKKAFAQSGHLQEHLRIHTGEKPFKCKFCRRAFTRSGHLLLHLRTHTGEKPFVCKICNKAFAQSGVLKNHLNTHSGEKPFKCTFCGKAFSRSGPLLKHLREAEKFH